MDRLKMWPAVCVTAVALMTVVAGCAADRSKSAETVKPQPAPTPAAAPAKPMPAPPSPPPAQPSRGAARVQFGIMPGNYDETGNGVLVGDVIPGTAAADASIQIDDRLVSWNGRPIKDVVGWMEYLGAAKPGDVVEVGVVRAGKTIPVKVTLKARKD